MNRGGLYYKEVIKENVRVYTRQAQHEQKPWCRQMTTSQIYVPKRPPRRTAHDIRGVRYQVYEWGDSDRPLLVLLHGWGDCGASFQFFVDELAGDWFVVAPDWRGFGETRLRSHAYWFPDYVADLDVLLSVYQPDRPVRLLGHSMGANVVGLYAGTFPERVRGFVNVEGFGLADSDPASAPDTYRRWIERARTMPAYATYAAYEDLAERIRRRSPGLSMERAMFVARHWAEEGEAGSIVLRADPAHKLPNAVQYLRAEAEACWDRVTAPVLLVVGENTDFRAAVSDWLDPDESRHPFHGAPTAVIQGAGHMVHLERPDALARAAEAFLTGRSPPVV
jgi:pimeloyl-ACP methyl ester carboxylesterase